MNDRLRLADAVRPGEYQESCFGTQTDVGGRKGPELRGERRRGAAGGVQTEACHHRRDLSAASRITRIDTYAEYRPGIAPSQVRPTTETNGVKDDPSAVASASIAARNRACKAFAATSDPLFLADLSETMADFGHVDAQG